MKRSTVVNSTKYISANVNFAFVTRNRPENSTKSSVLVHYDLANLVSIIAFLKPALFQQFAMQKSRKLVSPRRQNGVFS